MNDDVLIIGFGEIGKSLCEVYESSDINPGVRDPFLEFYDDETDCDVINICIPYFDFEQFSEAIKSLDVKDDAVFIIQTTMPMGTCNKLQEMIPNALVASPVRGVHPNLKEGLLTFEKYLGFTDKFRENEEVKSKVKKHLESIDIKSAFAARSNETELAKIISTSFYGMCIAFTQHVFNICEENKLDFESVLPRWQIGYNEGYEKLGKSNVRRPVLGPIPNKKKVIGGHCIIPNARFLKEMGSESAIAIADFILRFSNEESLVHKSKKKGDDNDSRYN